MPRLADHTWALTNMLCDVGHTRPGYILLLETHVC